ncbi:MAG: TerC family protein [Bdellovibrionales bacterium]
MLENYSPSQILWILFTVIVVVALAIDLGVLNRKSHKMAFKEAATWTSIWVALALGFNGAIYYFLGSQSAVEFLAGYLIEQSLSIDNLFVFIMLFSYFKVPDKYQHKILFWGIIGAVVMRAVFIATGIKLIHHFEWVLYLLGGMLVLMGLKMLRKKADEEHQPEKNIIIRLLKKVLPISDQYDGGNFLTVKNGKRMGTPLLLVLVAVETTDVVFAMDSIPAVIAITRDPFIVFTSNIFAILGLRSMFFVLAGVMNLFEYLSYGVAVILVYVGVKMLLMDVYKIPVHVTLIIMANIILVSILMSVLKKRRTEKNAKPAS